MLLGLSVHFLLFLSSILFFYNWSTFCLLPLSVSRFWFLFSLFLLWQRCGEPLSSSFLLKVQFSWFRDKNSHLKALASFLFFYFYNYSIDLVCSSVCQSVLVSFFSVPALAMVWRTFAFFISS